MSLNSIETMSGDTQNFVRSHQLLSRRESKLLVVDVQAKLLPHIPVSEKLVFNCRRLIRGAQVLGVPVAATEQYPQGLGPTVPELAELLDGCPQKLRFSCAEVLSWGTAAEQQDNRYQILVIGIEAHVCVQQTVLDLLSQGFQVYVAADAVASRHKTDWKIALQRMLSCGAVITTVEAALFEWCELAGTPEFKKISKLVQEQLPGG